MRCKEHSYRQYRRLLSKMNVFRLVLTAAGHRPKQQKLLEMNGAHLESPIRDELGYAHRPQLGSQIHCPIGNQIRGPVGKEDVCPNFALTVNKFVFNHSGNFRAKANLPKPRSCPKCPSGQWLGPSSSADWVNISTQKTY